MAVSIVHNLEAHHLRSADHLSEHSQALVFLCVALPLWARAYAGSGDAKRPGADWHCASWHGAGWHGAGWHGSARQRVHCVKSCTPDVTIEQGVGALSAV